jgi:hypothetical protein
MPDRDQGAHPEDLPWNDVPADDDVVIGSEEPDPAEVVGDEGAEVDVSHRSAPDPYHRDTLDERLAEEEPDRPARASVPEARDLQAPESGADDITVDRAEPDQAEPSDADSGSAEEAAIHLLDSDSAR